MLAHHHEEPGMTTSQTNIESEPILEAGNAASRPRAISKDDAYHLLQNSRRRAVLRYLLEHDPDRRFRMRDVAEAVAAWEHDTTVPRLTSKERSRVYIALYQTHLPKLDDHGVIEYDKERGHVELTPMIEVFEPYLENGLHTDRYCLLEDPDRRNTAGITRTVRTLFGT